MPGTPSRAELAHALFASELQRSEAPSPSQVREAIQKRLEAGWSGCVACVAQEAGDHPEVYRLRMAWALETVRRIYHPRPAAA